MHLCTPLPSEMLAYELNTDDTPEGLFFFSPEDTTSMIEQECQIWTCLTIKHIETVHFK